MPSIRRRGALLVTALLLGLSACTGTPASTTTTTTSRPTSTSAAVDPTSSTTTTTRPSVPDFVDDTETLPSDDEVLTGTLENGLRYYVRENDSPGGRAQFRLAIRAGSIQEAPGQRGAAHFLEHMAFNGTERYPANELIDVLQGFGAEFGPDINAYTSYEETVYELELPSTDPDVVATGIDVLFEWASAITLDPEEVDLERGVLIEEWRLRDQGFWGRYFAAVTDVLLAGTEYQGKRPLGTPEEVESMTPDQLRSFYEMWYRPDTMAVVAVGDFDGADIRQRITDRFGSLPPRDDPEPVPAPTTQPGDAVETIVLADPEAIQTWVELNYPLPRDPSDATVGALRREMAMDLAWRMIVTRLVEASLLEEVPFWNPSRAANPLVRRQASPGIAAYTDPADLATTTEELLAGIARAVQHGFTFSEFERAVGDERSEIRLAYDERATTQDAEFADRYVEGFLAETPVASAEQLFEVQTQILDEITPDLVWATFADTVESSDPVIILVSPERSAAGVPDTQAVARIADRVERTAYEPWVDDIEPLRTLMERPNAGDTSDKAPFSDSTLTQITLANGARLVAFPTAIRQDVVVMRAASPGGWAPLPPRDVAEARLAAAIALESGVGQIDQVTLDRTLSGHEVRLAPYIDETEEGFFGEAASRDLETLFQLVHLYMTAPRFEEVALDLAVAENLPYAVDPGQVPELAVLGAVLDARYDGDSRFAIVPPEEELRTLDLRRVAEIFRDRFDDPADFVFVFAGDFDPDQLEDLAGRYLGSITGSSETEEWIDIRPAPPSAIERRVVEAGTGVLGGVTLYYSTEYPLDADTRVTIDLLQLVLQDRLTKRIREELSASYSPFAYVELSEAPVETVDIWIQVSADPEDLDEITRQTLAVVEGLRSDGPTASELATAGEQLRLDYELFSNESLADAIVFSALHPDEPLTEIVTRIDRTLDHPAGAIRDLARDLMPEDRYVEVRLVPQG